jgi:hypothetical protein
MRPRRGGHRPGPGTERRYLPMQDQPNPRDAAAELDQLQRVVLHLLLDGPTAGIWSEREVAKAVGGEAHAQYALVNLHADGLIHRCNEFVFATRPAVRFWEFEKVH